MKTPLPAEGRIEPTEVRRRAAAGALLIAIRTATTQVIALTGNIILARLLVPEDFGAVAFGATLVTVATFFSDGGMGVALIRRGDDPSRDDLRALLGFQLATSSALAALTLVAGSFFGRVGLVAGLMALSLPFVAARAPSTIVLERSLHYRPIVIAELVESVTFYAWSIPLVLAGFGVWGLASGAVVRSAVATVLLVYLSSSGWIGPRFDFGRLRALLGFGARFQARGVVALARDEGLNLGIAVVAGISVLGLWSLAARVMQVPFLVFSALLRVSYPAMSQLNRAGEELGVTVDNLAAVTSLLAVAVLGPLSGVADQLVPAVFGERSAPGCGHHPLGQRGSGVQRPHLGRMLRLPVCHERRPHASPCDCRERCHLADRRARSGRGCRGGCDRDRVAACVTHRGRHPLARRACADDRARLAGLPARCLLRPAHRPLRAGRRDVGGRRLGRRCRRCRRGARGLLRARPALRPRPARPLGRGSSAGARAGDGGGQGVSIEDGMELASSYLPGAAGPTPSPRIADACPRCDARIHTSSPSRRLRAARGGGRGRKDAAASDRRSRRRARALGDRFTALRVRRFDRGCSRWSSPARQASY